MKTTTRRVLLWLVTPVIHRCGHLIVVSQSIVPEVDEEEEEKVVDTLSDVFPHPGESPKTSKRMLGLIELVLVSAHRPTPFRHLSQPVASLTGRGISDATQG